jgi:hypothetical protein
VAIAKLLTDRLIEFSHQCDLLRRTEVSLHELLKLPAEGRYSLAVAAHIGQRNPRHDAIGAD